MGYVAVIECRRVHVDRPSCSTSGGQSEVEGEEGPVVVVVVGLEVVDWDDEGDDLACLVKARQDAADVQSRHLVFQCLVRSALGGKDGWKGGEVRFPVLVEDDSVREFR